MPAHPGLRRAAIAAGSTASLLILTAWSVSVFWLIGYTDRNRAVLINLEFGRLNCLHFAPSPSDSFEAVPDFIYDFQSEFPYRTRVSVVDFWSRRPGWFAIKLFSPPDGRVTEKLGLGLPTMKKQDRTTIGRLFGFSVPLWLPFLLAAIPTAYVWHRHRPRLGQDHCPHCNYNMTGNQSGKCPECGTPTATATPNPAPQTPPHDTPPK